MYRLHCTQTRTRIHLNLHCMNLMLSYILYVCNQQHRSSFQTAQAPVPVRHVIFHLRVFVYFQDYSPEMHTISRKEKKAAANIEGVTITKINRNSQHQPSAPPANNAPPRSVTPFPLHILCPRIHFISFSLVFLVRFTLLWRQ